MPQPQPATPDRPDAPDPPGVAARLVEIESKLAFAEHTLDDLSEVLADQGRTLEALERRVAEIEERASPGSGVAGAGELADPRGELPEELPDELDERPPHY